nr:hypothetical protein CFP56_37279 [Quercus suber]
MVGCCSARPEMSMEREDCGELTGGGGGGERRNGVPACGSGQKLDAVADDERNLSKADCCPQRSCEVANSAAAPAVMDE